LHQGTTLQDAEKLIAGRLCNKGMASAGPQEANRMSWALAPAKVRWLVSIPHLGSFTSLFTAPQKTHPEL
jgi:hypothetical protein